MDFVKRKTCPADTNSFGEFLGKIFHSNQDRPGVPDRALLLRIPEYTMDDLCTALSQLTNLRCTCTDGVVVEMLGHGNNPLHPMLLRCFNDVLRSGSTLES